MSKNMIIAVLAACCLFLAVGLYDQRGEVLAMQAQSSQAIDPAAYGGLVALRDILPAETFQKEVLPVLQKAREGIPVTEVDLQALSQRLPQLPMQALAAAEAERTKDKLSRIWDQTTEGASELGSQIGRSMEEMLDGLTRMLEKEPVAPQADAPTEI